MKLVKPAEPLPELVTPNTLAKRYAMNSDDVYKKLKAAGLAPAAEQVVGRGSWRFYKRDEALAVLDKIVAERNAASNPTPAKDANNVAVALLHEQNELLNKLIEGNRVMFGLVQTIDARVKKMAEDFGCKTGP